MWAGHEGYYHAPILDPLDGLVARVHAQLFADLFLDRYLATFADSARHRSPTFATITYRVGSV